MNPLALLIAILTLLVCIVRRSIAVCYGLASEFVVICGPTSFALRRWLVVARGCIPPPRTLVLGLLVVATLVGSCAVASAQLPLTGQQVHYKFDSNFDDSLGTHDFTATNSPSFAAGKIGNGVDLESGSAQHLSVADHANLSTGDVSFYVSLWHSLESKGAQRYLAGKFTSTDIEWVLDYLNTSDRYRFYIRSSGGTFVIVEASSFGSPPLGTPTHIVAWYDTVANTVNIRVNNGPVNSTAVGAVVPPDTATPLRVGYAGVGSVYGDGVVDELLFGKGHIITTGEQDALWNGGAGVTLVVDEITISRPRTLEIVQRKNLTHGDITITGAYTYQTTPPTAIEARVVWTHPAHTSDWEVIDASPSGGTYSGTLVDVPIGSGQVQTRFANDTAVTVAQTSVGVGANYLTAGQSLIQGRADSSQSLDNPTGQLALKFREGHVTAELLTDPTDGTVAFGTPIPQVATVLLADNPDCPIQFVTTADGGTTLAVSPFDWRVPDGASYVDMQATAAAADLSGYEGVIWGQGESEAYEGVAERDYLAAVLPTLEALHDLPGDPWVMVMQTGQLPTVYVPGAQAIRQAQRRTWPLDFVRPGPSTYDMLYSVDETHPRTNPEIEEQATRIAWAILGNTPPVIRAITTTPGSGQILLHYDQTLTTNALLSTAPWVVPGHTVFGASASGDTVELITSPSVNAGEAVSVTLGAGNTGVEVAVPLSTIGMPAAAETFYQSTGVYEMARP